MERGGVVGDDQRALLDEGHEARDAGFADQIEDADVFGGDGEEFVALLAFGRGADDGDVLRQTRCRVRAAKRSAGHCLPGQRLGMGAMTMGELPSPIKRAMASRWGASE